LRRWPPSEGTSTVAVQRRPQATDTDTDHHAQGLHTELDAATAVLAGGLVLAAVGGAVAGPAVDAAPATVVDRPSAVPSSPTTPSPVAAQATPAPAESLPAEPAPDVEGVSVAPAARAAGAAPVHRGEPGYGAHLDRDEDGVGCDS
jgi:hypothetical protein